MLIDLPVTVHAMASERYANVAVQANVLIAPRLTGRPCLAHLARNGAMQRGRRITCVQHEAVFALEVGVDAERVDVNLIGDQYFASSNDVSR